MTSFVVFVRMMRLIVEKSNDGGMNMWGDRGKGGGGTKKLDPSKKTEPNKKELVVRVI